MPPQASSGAEADPSFTGERVIPGAVSADLWNEHVARYRFAAVFAAGKRVLDVGCGAGYGTGLLAEVAHEATGFDISPDAVHYALSHYPAARFLIGSALDFPVRSASFDVITAFEVIEHLADWPRLLEEANRVLAPGGVFLVSTPNKPDYAQARQQAGPNPFHVHEFERTEFEQALASVFPFVRLLAQNQQEAIVFAGEQTKSSGLSFVADRPRLEEAQFFLAICTKAPLDIPCFAYASSASNLLRERERWALGLDRELGIARERINGLLQELEERTSWARSLEAEWNAARAALTSAEARLARLLQERELIRASRWLRLGRALHLGPNLDSER